MEQAVVGMIHERVRELLSELGWTRLTDVQEKALPAILSGKNTVIVAPTGMGKTEAALLPVFSRMVEEKPQPVALLYITPLRALINDIYVRIKWWADRLGFIVSRKHGDVPQAERAKRLRKAPHILVTTPESLEIDLDWATRFRENYRNLKWVIVDEVHEIVGTKRGVQLAILLERLRRIAGDFQLILLSATIGDPLLAGKAFTGSSKRPLVVVESSVKKKPRILVDYVEHSSDFWRRAAEKLASHIEPLTLVFVNSRYVAERLHEALEKLGYKNIAVHHASISGREKESIEQAAREGRIDAIICTKTLELGIDLGSVRKVVLFRPTGTVFSLLQRIGRSGHTITGRPYGVIIATDKIELIEAIAESSLAVQGVVEKPRLPDKPLDVAARAVTGMALSGNYSLDEAYDILHSTLYYRGLSREEFNRLIEFLSSVRLIKTDNGRLKTSSTFYRIWRFSNDHERGAWWVKSFAEFFTLIGERETFTVKTLDGRVVGELDTEYVYRTLRPGSVIRLGGRNWHVISIDEQSQKVTVTEAPEATTSVPVWRGHGPSISELVIREMERIVRELHSGAYRLPEGVELTDDASRALRDYIEHVRRYRVPPLSASYMIVDRVADETVVLMLMDEKVSRTLALLPLSRNPDGQVRVAYYGFSIGDMQPSQLIAWLKSLDRSEFEDLIRMLIPRTPYFMETARQIQFSFGITRRITMDDSVAYEEAIRQTLQEYFDVENAWRIIKGVQEGRVKILVAPSGPNPYAIQLLHEPVEKLWSYGIEDLIAETLQGMAFTAEELADAIAAPVNLVEARLREMRKPESRIRVFSFIDVDTGEERWALVEDADELVSSEEFSASFQPQTDDGLYLVLVKGKNGGLIHVTVTPRDLAENPESLVEKIPFEEVYEVKVTPLTSYYDGKSPKYTHVPRRILPYIVLNAIAVLQKLQQTDIL